MLAGLDWETNAYRHDPSSEDGQHFRCDRCDSELGEDELGEMVAPADIVLGWLCASKVTADYEAAGPSFADGLHEVSGVGLIAPPSAPNLRSLQPCTLYLGLVRLTRYTTASCLPASAYRKRELAKARGLLASSSEGTVDVVLD